MAGTIIIVTTSITILPNIIFQVPGLLLMLAYTNGKLLKESLVRGFPCTERNAARLSCILTSQTCRMTCQSRKIVALEPSRGCGSYGGYCRSPSRKASKEAAKKLSWFVYIFCGIQAPSMHARTSMLATSSNVPGTIRGIFASLAVCHDHHGSCPSRGTLTSSRIKGLADKFGKTSSEQAVTMANCLCRKLPKTLAKASPRGPIRVP